ncbi:succinate dehydrogenase, hydrophobic membrane anchor protein [Alphaproteobacteria bacterium]|nr:succinate dehydrogenase, hydrophobic membrane anchor protein [Alphaproteobacteria bacterium]
MSHLSSPLKKAKGLGSVRKGAHHWLVFRLLAVLMIPLTLWFVFFLLQHVGQPYEIWISSLKRTHNVTFLTLTTLALFYHSYHGLMEIVVDYLKPGLLKTAFLIMIPFGYAVMGLVAFLSLLQIYLG